MVKLPLYPYFKILFFLLIETIGVQLGQVQLDVFSLLIKWLIRVLRKKVLKFVVPIFAGGNCHLMFYS